MAYRSHFSYNLTRPYPYKWFTPVLIAGGIVAAILFSLWNVASQGYEQTSRSSPNPNETLAQRDWLSNWPLVGVDSSCESISLPLQSQVYTNNTVFPYTISSVWKVRDNGESYNLGSLSYFNQPLQQCNITSITTNIDTTFRSAGQMALIPAGGTVEALVECYFDNQDGRTFVALSALYDPVPARPRAYLSSSYFVYSNQTYQANMYWAASLMRNYWADVMFQFAKKNKDRSPQWLNGNFGLRRKSDKPNATAHDVISSYFFRISCFLNQDVAPDVVSHFDFCDRNNVTSLSEPSAGHLHMPEFWSSLDVLSKAFYFAVLADLGQAANGDEDGIPNVLADKKTLQELTKGLTGVNGRVGGSGFKWGIGNGTSAVSFDPKDFPHIDLSISPSVLASTYLCKVRKLKSSATLIMAVLVADIVFMSSLWRIYVWAVDSFYVGERATLPPCACYGQQHGGSEDAIPLKAMGQTRSPDETGFERVSTSSR